LQEVTQSGTDGDIQHSGQDKGNSEHPLAKQQMISAEEPMLLYYDTKYILYIPPQRV
jgi:hypothetical protein